MQGGASAATPGLAKSENVYSLILMVENAGIIPTGNLTDACDIVEENEQHASNDESRLATARLCLFAFDCGLARARSGTFPAAEMGSRSVAGLGDCSHVRAGRGYAGQDLFERPR